MATRRRIIRPISQQDVARFWSYVDKTAGQGPWGNCWTWTRGKFHGYGSMYAGGRQYAAHRLAYWITQSRWPMPCGLHSCDNPPCVNPAHIAEGTDAENNAQMTARGRGRSARGDANGSRTHPERRPRGDANGNAKHSDEVIAAVRVAPGPYRKIAVQYGMSHQYVSRIKRGENRSPL